MTPALKLPVYKSRKQTKEEKQKQVRVSYKYRGWIKAEYGDGRKLRSLGIVLEDYNAHRKMFINCHLSVAAFENFVPYWNQFPCSLKLVTIKSALRLV